MIQLTATIDGVEQMSRNLSNLADGIKDFSPALEKVGDLMLNVFDQNFDSQGSLLAGGWPARKGDYPWPILQKTGELRKSFDKIYTNEEVSMFNTDQPIYHFHQFGTSRGLPPRIMMKLDNERISLIQKVFQEYIHQLTGSWR